MPPPPPHAILSVRGEGPGKAVLLPPAPFYVSAPYGVGSGMDGVAAGSRQFRAGRKEIIFRNLKETESGVPEEPREGRRNP